MLDKKVFASDLLKKLNYGLKEGHGKLLEQVQKVLTPSIGEPDLWEAALLLGAYYNEQAVSSSVRDLCVEAITQIREFEGKRALESTAPTTVVFGTSGWRGVIGEDFTLLNVHKVVRGILDMMKTPTFLETNRYTSFEEVKKNGILVLRDNRYMGDTFMMAAMKELAAEGIKILDAGECPTGVGSALLTELRAAGSINFTPSHNPMNYAGLKFNPADGGPADPSITTLIEEKANAYMKPGVAFTPATADPTPLRTKIAGAALFTSFVERKSKVFDLEGIRAWLREVKSRLMLIVDFMHGAARGYVERLLGEDLVEELQAAGALQLLNTETDYSFHGVKPEPSAKNQKPLIEMLKKSGRELTLAVALDPDADRIRFADATMDIDMNRFGAIIYASLLARGIRGGIASTAPSSDFALEIAKQEGEEVFETEVGFKNFRGPLSSGKAIVAFEESDGISFIGHTLEKCALAGFLAALSCMRATGKNLSVQYEELRKKYGYFYPDKAGADVKGVSIEEWQAYKNAVVDVLQHKLFKVGDTVEVGSTKKTIKAINIIDGLKVIFEDRSWILLRPSGTEPKFRYYYELASSAPIPDYEKRLAEYREAGGRILAMARAKVDAAR